MKKKSIIFLIVFVFLFSLFSSALADDCYDRLRKTLVSYFGEPNISSYFPNFDELFSKGTVTVAIYEEDKQWNIVLALHDKNGKSALTVLESDAQNAEDVLWYVIGYYDEYNQATTNQFVVWYYTSAGRYTIESEEVASLYFEMYCMAEVYGYEKSFKGVQQWITDIRNEK